MRARGRLAMFKPSERKGATWFRGHEWACDVVLVSKCKEGKRDVQQDDRHQREIKQGPRRSCRKTLAERYHVYHLIVTGMVSTLNSANALASVLHIHVSSSPKGPDRTSELREILH
jgi:hypothetical protein